MLFLRLFSKFILATFIFLLLMPAHVGAQSKLSQTVIDAVKRTRVKAAELHTLTAPANKTPAVPGISAKAKDLANSFKTSKVLVAPYDSKLSQEMSRLESIVGGMSESTFKDNNTLWNNNRATFYKETDGSVANDESRDFMVLSQRFLTSGGSTKSSVPATSGSSGTGSSGTAPAAGTSTGATTPTGAASGAGFEAPTLGNLGKDKSLSSRLQNDQAVISMWKVMLGLADAIVVVFFVVIAFATILHINYDTYGVKKALPTLILGIILAHFSLLIVRYIVDFGQVAAASFFNSAGQNTSNPGNPAQGLAINLSEAIFKGGIGSLGNSVTWDTWIRSVGFLGIGAAAVAVGAATGFIWIALLVAVIAIFIPSLLILILAFMLYIRVYAIIFLTIIAPVAWLCQAWPPVQGIFKKWWQNFFKYVAMGPIIIFFLWFPIQFDRISRNFDATEKVADLGSYLLALVMLYLAIKVPMGLGAQGFSEWTGVGSKALSAARKHGQEGIDRRMEVASQTPLGKRLRVNSWRNIKGQYKEYIEDEHKPKKVQSELDQLQQYRQGIVAQLPGLKNRLAGMSETEAASLNPYLSGVRGRIKSAEQKRINVDERAAAEWGDNNKYRPRESRLAETDYNKVIGHIMTAIKDKDFEFIGQLKRQNSHFFERLRNAQEGTKEHAFKTSYDKQLKYNAPHLMIDYKEMAEGMKDLAANANKVASSYWLYENEDGSAVNPSNLNPNDNDDLPKWLFFKNLTENVANSAVQRMGARDTFSQAATSYGLRVGGAPTPPVRAPMQNWNNQPAGVNLP